MITIGTFYFRIESPLGVFRRRREPKALFVERYDVPSGSWVDDMAGLAGYLYNGEVGATPISEEEAHRLIETLKPPP